MFRTTRALAQRVQLKPQLARVRTVVILEQTEANNLGLSDLFVFVSARLRADRRIGYLAFVSATCYSARG